MSMMNRLANCHNIYQGKDLKVLCVCSAGLLRSPTMARLISREYENTNTRAVGYSHEYALCPLEDVHVEWADVILSADLTAWTEVNNLLKNMGIENTDNFNMEIPDRYAFGAPKLEEIIRAKLDDIPIFKDMLKVE